MIIRMNVNRLYPVTIGYEGENAVKQIEFDYSPWVVAYGEGILTVLVKRYGDADPYPVTTDVDGYEATWTIDGFDTQNVGEGEIQLVYTSNGAIKKSAVVAFNVVESLEPSSAEPKDFSTWVDELLTVGASAQLYAQQAEESAADALGHANNASDSADEASTYATNASNSADNALEYAQQVQAKVTESRQNAENASQSAIRALASANSAEQSANDASNYAATAQEQAHDAFIYSQQAAQEASKAKTASNKAKEYADSISEAVDAVQEYAQDAENAKNIAEAAVATVNSSVDKAAYYADKAETEAESIKGLTVSATTLSAGSSATAEYDSETGNLALGIPKGDNGETPHFSIGTVETGEAGSEVEVDITGTDENPVLNFSIPQGEAGITPSFSIGTVTTGEAGSDAEVTISGTDENPVLNFTIPQGEKGEDGEVSQQDLDDAVSDLNEALKTKADVITNSASGSIASFSDGAAMDADSFVINFEPVQDLHGQDAPYPAGGGANKCDEEWELGGIATTTGEPTTSTTNIRLKHKIPVTPSSSTYIGLGELKNIYFFSYDENGEFVRYIGLRTISGAITLQSNDYFLWAYQYNDITPTKLWITNGATATEWSPYENICPITGWTGVDGYVRSVNLWDEELELGYINESGVFVDSDVNLRSKNLFAVYPSTSFYASCKSASSGNRFGYRFYDKSGVYISGNTANINSIITSPSNAQYMAFFVPTSWYGSTYKNDISINYPSSDHDYHAYAGHTYPVTWTEHGTMYGGFIDLVSGRLVGGYTSVILDGSNEYGFSNWLVPDAEKDTLGFYINAYNWLAPTQYNLPAPSLTPNDKYNYCKKMGVYNNNTPWTANLLIVSGAFNRFEIRVPKNILADISTEEAAKSSIRSYLSEHPLQITYQLAEPVEYQLTGQQVQTLLGNNNCFSNSNGEVSITYKADTKKYIDNKILEAVTNALNS